MTATGEADRRLISVIIAINRRRSIRLWGRPDKAVFCEIDRIAGFNAYVRVFDPTNLRESMLTGINALISMGRSTGDEPR